MKGSLIPRHFMVSMTPEEAASIREFLSDFHQQWIKERGDFFGLRENEDEAITALIEALDDPGDNGAGQPAVMTSA